jgi:hypothetical protein
MRTKIPITTTMRRFNARVEAFDAFTGYRFAHIHSMPGDELPLELLLAMPAMALACLLAVGICDRAIAKTQRLCPPNGVTG